jgi:copper(I)-binding protein
LSTFQSKFTLILLALVLLVGCAPQPATIQIQDAWLRPTSLGNNAALYFSIANNLPESVVILSASSEAARAVEIHESMMMAADDLNNMIEGNEDSVANDLQMQDVMQMTALNEVEIGSGETLLFEPGGLHIMLVDIQQEFELGMSVMLRLNFENGESLSLEAVVSER